VSARDVWARDHLPLSGAAAVVGAGFAVGQSRLAQKEDKMELNTRQMRQQQHQH
jgi:hypothetical protein